MPSFLHLVLDVVVVAAEDQVSGTEPGRIVAVMENTKAVGNRPDAQSINKPMQSHGTLRELVVVKIEQAVARLVCATQPFPAAGLGCSGLFSNTEQNVARRQTARAG